VYDERRGVEGSEDLRRLNDISQAVMLALIVVVCVTVIRSLGTSISGTFSSVQSTLGGS
jgi:Flp pilus assembly pilin Flp